MSRRSRSGSSSSSSASSSSRARWHPIALLTLARRQLRDEGDDLHHRRRLRASSSRRGRRPGVSLGRGGTVYSGRAPARDDPVLGFAPWAWGVAAFLVVYTLLFSTFLTNPEGLQEGLWRKHRLLARAAGREPRLAAVVLLPRPSSRRTSGRSCCSAPAASSLRFGGGRSPTLLVWTFVVTLAIFSWASERMPWLVAPPAAPADAARRHRCRRRSGSRGGAWPAAAAMAVVGPAAAGCVSSLDQPLLLPLGRSRASSTSRCRPPTTCRAIRDKLMRLEAAWTREHGEPFVPVVDSWGGTGWPWSWYLRDVGSGFYDLSAPPDDLQLGAGLSSSPTRTMRPCSRGCQGYTARALPAARVVGARVGSGGPGRLGALGGLPRKRGGDPDRDDGRMALSEPGARPTGCLRPVGLARCPRAS